MGKNFGFDVVNCSYYYWYDLERNRNDLRSATLSIFDFKFFATAKMWFDIAGQSQIRLAPVDFREHFHQPYYHLF